MKLKNYSYAEIRRDLRFSFLSPGKPILIAITFALALLALPTPGYSQQNSLVSFSFSLNNDSKTSAGVFKRDGTLIRTLWNNVSYKAGTHTSTWDRRDDHGRMVTDTGLVVKVVSNNVKYKWEGVIGNTSDSLTGNTVIRMFDRMHGMAIIGNTAYYGAGYTEGITSSYKFRTNDPQKKYNLLYSDVQQMYQASEFVATDSIYVYWAGYDPFVPQTSFVYATRVSDDREVNFSNGTSVNITYGRTYSKVIDLTTGNINGVPKGLAVQKSGPYLFVSHPKLGELHVLNKLTGALVQNISMSSPRDLAVDRNDNLWIISSANTVEKFTVNSNGTLSSPVLSISGLVSPLAIAVSPDNSTVAIIDGGSSQQIKAFSNLTAAALWTYGQAGGYASDPAVTNDKFYFSDTVTMLSKPFIAFQPDGSFWVADVGNERVQHYASSRVFIDRIMCLPHSYSVVVDRNNATRVFNEYLEFQVDYSKPLAPNNGSWTLVRNWRHGITKDYFQEGKVNIFNQVVTLSNGRTYATLENCSTPDVRYPEIVELPASGHVRYTGVRFGDFSKDFIATDGSLRRFISSGKTGDAGYWEAQALTGFSSNNPTWAAPSTIGSIPTIAEGDPANGQVSHPVMTSSDILVLFERERYNKGFHLGAVRKNDNKYLWKACPATTRDYSGPFPTDGAFDIGNNVEYAGGHVYALERNILWNYHGEFWKNGQTNIWNHFYDNGLMIGQFGTSSLDGQKINIEAFAMGAGNVFASTLLKYGNDYYIYHNDESVHAGVHRWKISGLNTIDEQTIAVSPGSIKPGGLDGYYYDGQNLDNVYLKISMLHPSVDIKTPPVQISNPQNYSARWQGFVNTNTSGEHTFYVQANKGTRLWIDGQLVIDQWKNTASTEFASLPVLLEHAKLYSIRLESNGGNTRLLWSDAQQAKQLVPPSHLYPLSNNEEEEGIDLLEGLLPYSTLEDGLYGWYRDPENEDSTSDHQYWNIKTNIKTGRKEKPDLYMTFRQDKGFYQAARSLGQTNDCQATWKIKGRINFEDNHGNWDADGGSFIDVLDLNGKIIARITHELIFDDAHTFPTQIKCNGEAIFNQVYSEVESTLSSEQDFEISVSGNGIIFSYAHFIAMAAPFYDPTCQWNKPAGIRFGFQGGTNNYSRAVDISRLRFITSPAPVLHIAGTTSFCEGNSAELTAPVATSYLWNTGEITRSVTVKSSGYYSVSTGYANGCRTASQAVQIQVNPLPKPTIKLSGSKLVSDYEEGNQWYFNDEIINGAVSSTYTASAKGKYTLVVTDNNQCTGSVSFEFTADIDQPETHTVKISPNPGGGIYHIDITGGRTGVVYVYDINGKLVWENDSANNEVNLSGHMPGVYMFIFVEDKHVEYHKIVLNN